jgi:exodeoxyribonuclease VII small subunit
MPADPSKPPSPAPGAPGHGPSDRDRSYAELADELDGIVREFEDGTVDLDALVGRLERAHEIVTELARRIADSRMRVDKIVPELLEAAARAEQGAGSGGKPGRTGAASRREPLEELPGLEELDEEFDEELESLDGLDDDPF